MLFRSSVFPPSKLSGFFIAIIVSFGVNANVRQEGNNILIELISQKIANDYADGSNGWASAIAVQQQSSIGLSVSR